MRLSLSPVILRAAHPLPPDPSVRRSLPGALCVRSCVDPGWRSMGSEVGHQRRRRTAGRMPACGPGPTWVGSIAGNGFRCDGTSAAARRASHARRPPAEGTPAADRGLERVDSRRPAGRVSLSDPPSAPAERRRFRPSRQALLRDLRGCACTDTEPQSQALVHGAPGFALPTAHLGPGVPRGVCERTLVQSKRCVRATRCRQTPLSRLVSPTAAIALFPGIGRELPTSTAACRSYDDAPRLDFQAGSPYNKRTFV
jgi:hypothetical protein